jgi:hypothetical protein
MADEISDELANKKIWSAKDLAAFCRIRQENELDYTMVLTGVKGSGKSTAALQIARAIDKGYTLERNVILTPDPQKVAEAIDGLNSAPCVVLDEAIGALYTENWAAKGQKGLHVFLNQFQRKDKFCVLVLCIPSIFDLRGPLLRSSVDMWIHLFGRGDGVIMIRTAMPVPDPFMRDRLLNRWEYVAAQQNCRDKVLAQRTADFQRIVYRGMPTFLKFIKFEALPTEEYNEYMDYVRANKNEIRDAIFEASDDEKIKNQMRRLNYERRKNELEEGTPRRKSGKPDEGEEGF